MNGYQSPDITLLSEKVMCERRNGYDASTARRQDRFRNHVYEAPPLVYDRDLNAVPRATVAKCWPATTSREIAGNQVPTGFLLRSCAATNANEVVVGRDEVCSRSHQLFMNTTRRCTGTFDPRARSSCANEKDASVDSPGYLTR